ncbi:MAG: hypothetical protein PUC65_01590 [Clostridiales bacterium]|nr:hypothetical protein [Clostridiales bacterium]
MTRSKGNYVLQDSSVFSELDTILELDIKDVKIEDIKGFLDMESLKKIYVSKESMTKDQINELESNGVQVMVE